MANAIAVDIKFSTNGNAVMGRLSMDASELTKAVGRVRSVTSAMSNSFDKFTGTCASFTFALQGAVDGLSGLASNAMSFDTAMRAANTMADKGTEEYNKLRESVKGLSKEIPIAREALAEGLYQVVSNGVPEDNWISFLDKSARSSVGGMADLGDTVKVTSTIIKNYGYAWDDAGSIQDKIQLTAKRGVTDFSQLAQSLPKVTGNAAELGVEINELLATFSTLTGVSGNTAEVSTQLAAVFTALVKPSSEATKMAKAMGIEFNAASIRAAGGLQGFLQSLDGAVKRYAAANGVLEDAVYGKLFGSAESLRALGPLTGQLADKFNENVAAMADSAGTMDRAYEEMAESGESNAQRMKNVFANATDAIGSLAATILPSVQFVAYFGQSMAGMSAIVKTGALVFGRLKTVVMAIPGALRKCSIAMNAFAATSQRAKIAVNGVKYAIKGLMSATAIGIVITVLTSAIDALINSADDASDAADEAAKEMAEWKKSLTDLSQATGQAVAKEITVLEKMYRTATDETKSRKERLEAADNLKTIYGDTFKNLTTEAIMAGQAAKAYDELKKSIMETAKAKAAQAQIEKNAAEWISMDTQRQDLEKELEPLKEDVAQKKAATDAIPDATVVMNGSIAGNKRKDDADKAYEDAVATLDETERKIAELKEKQADIDEANARLEQYISSGATSTAPEGGGFKDLDELLNGADKTYKQKLEAQLAKAKDAYVQASVAGNETEAASQKKVIDGLREQIATVEMLEKKMERPAELKTLEDIDAEMRYQQALRQTASTEVITGIDKEIARLNRLKAEMEGVKIKAVEEIKTQEELAAARQYYESEMQKAGNVQRREIQKTLNALDELEARWNRGLEELKAPGDISTLKTLEKMSEASDYYTRRQQRATADEVAGYERLINAIKRKETAQRRGAEIADAQNEVARLKDLGDREYRVEVRGIGFEALGDKIRDLRRMLDDKENPLSDGLRADAEELIREYERMRLTCVTSFEGIKNAWSHISGLGSGVDGITKAVKENGNAWERVTGIIDGTMRVYESIGALINIIQIAVRALTAGKQAEATATTVATAAKVAEAVTSEAAAAAQAPVIATNKEVTASYMEMAAAAFFAAHAEIPLVGFALGAGFITAATAMVAAAGQIPKFADGGIAYGPTLGIFGEYAGASNNPEVVAPLSKLRELIAPSDGGTGGRVVFEIAGRKLVGILERENKLNSRT